MENNYKEPITDWNFGSLYTVRDFKTCVKNGMFIDYDGSGYAVKKDMVDTDTNILPSEVKNIPKDATHILWFNR